MGEGTVRPRGAFTLIEVLVVVAIIALLTALTLTGIGAARRAADRKLVGDKVQGVLEGLRALGPEDGSLAYRLHRQALGLNLRFATLREILTGPGVDPEKRPDDIPPNIKLRNSAKFFDARGKPTVTQPADMRIDEWVLWLLRDRSDRKQLANEWRRVEGDDWYLTSTASQNTSQLGETLDGTFEVAPSEPQKPSWYIERWPVLVEQKRGQDPNATYEQTSWPASDWDQSEPGDVPPVWASAWGRDIIARASGNLVPQKERHHLGELSPLATVALLQAAGKLQAGDAGAEEYRTRRGRTAAWNDPWGNPLVVSFAAFIPARYDFVGQEQTRDLAGGRDHLLKLARERYGFNRAVYLAVGAPGPVLRTALPQEWKPADDRGVLRDLWKQIREVTDAKRWNEQAWATPPWKGDIEEGRKGRERCFIGSPVQMDR